MKDDKLDLFWFTLLVVLFLSYVLLVIFNETEMWIAACVALGVFVLSLVTCVVLLIIKIVKK